MATATAIDVSTAPTVKVTGTVRAPIDQVWKLFRPFGKEIMNWWPIYTSAELEAPGQDEVGAVRLISTKTGRTYQEKLIERDDSHYRERYDMLSAKPAVPSFKGAATIVQMTDGGDGTTQILWQSWSEASSLLLGQIKAVQTQTYIDAIADLDRHFNPALGTLDVTVVSAQGLDNGSHQPTDPYVLVSLDDAAPLTTKAKHFTETPVFNHRFTLDVLSNNGKLRVAVWDANLGRDVSLGAASFDLHELTGGQRVSKTLQLAGSEGMAGGTVQVELLLTLDSGEQLTETETEQQLSHLATLESALGKLQQQALQLAQQISKGPQSVWGYGRYDRSPQLPDVPLEQLPHPVVGLPPEEALDPKKVAGMLERGIEYLYSQAQFMTRAATVNDPYLAYFGDYVAAPEYIVEHWHEDAELARQFIQGVGPLVIQRVTDISSVPATMHALTPGGESLQQLIARQGLFLLDYEALAPLKPYRDMVFYAPYVLVYKEQHAEHGERLNLAAIQLTRHSDKDNAVYTPERTPTNRWQFAKMHAACADNQYHQWLFHLGFAHLAMEPAIIAWHNALPAGHVIRELLAPHTDDTIGINFLARQTLVSEVAPFTDQTFSTGTAQALQMFLSAWQKYDFFEHSFPSDLEARGFNEARDDGLQDYYFRDDGFLVWNAIGRYVQGVVEASYADDAAVAADPALQAWAKESTDADKAAIPGFPTAFHSRERLSDTLQTLIWALSAQHSAVNFSQFDFLSYVPNRPDSLFREMPEGDAEIPLSVIQAALPNPKISQFQISFAWMLSNPSDHPLTTCTAMAERLPEVHQRFMADLAVVSNTINARNQQLVDAGKDPYPYLLPERVASSIAI